jgi:DNA (cytosine-5)-methyltransferase 1
MEEPQVMTPKRTEFGKQGVVTNYRIRKLTPRECFRLMGVNDADIDKIQAVGISNSQQYKMAGNSIVVDNLYHIFRTMFVDKPTKRVKQLTLF